MTTVIPSERTGNCALCGKDYPSGTRIAKDRRTGKWVMADCLWPKSAKASSPNAEPSPKQASLARETSIFDADIGVLVEKRLATAKEIVSKSMPSLDRQEGYPMVLAEVLHQLGAEAMSIRIQACKERNISVVRQ